MKISTLFSLCVSVSILSIANAYAVDIQLDIYPKQQKQQVKFGADIKLTLKRVEEGNTEKIFDRFIEMGMDMVRMPFYPTRDISDEFYDKVYRVADIAEDKGLIIFASVANGDGDLNNNLHGAHKFSDSLICNSCDDNLYNLNLTAYAAYMDDFIANMALHDAKIDFFAPFNEDRGLVTDYQKIWQQMSENDFQRLGPELWGLGNSVKDTPKLLDLIDVVGAHFYDDETIAIEEQDDKWASLKTAASGKEVWFTEATRFETSNSEITNLRSGLEHIIPAIRGGVDRVVFYQAANRFVWYNGGMRAYRFSGVKQFTTHASGHVVDSNSDDLAVKTVSFIDEDTLTVNITNGDSSAKVATINLQDNYLAFGSGDQALWTEAVEAEFSAINFDSISCWTMTIPANAYLQLSVPVIVGTESSPNSACVHIALPQDAQLPDHDVDGIADFFDEDDDNDMALDIDDAFPFDASESIDTDTDGIGNNADLDDDNDTVVDTEDAFPLDATKSAEDNTDSSSNNDSSTNSSGGGASIYLFLLLMMTARRLVRQG